MQALWVAHQNVNCIPFIFIFNFFLERIFQMNTRTPSSLEANFSIDLWVWDDRGPLPSRCGKYHIYNFGNRTGALEMWVCVCYYYYYYYFIFFKKKRCSRIILPVQQSQFLLNNSKRATAGLSTFKAAERELCTIGVCRLGQLKTGNLFMPLDVSLP